jgi:serine/threonine protein kinase
VIFYEILTGQKPYKSESVIDIIFQYKQAPISHLPDRYSNYQKFLELMMAKDRRNRFRDADALIHYIKQLRKLPQNVAEGDGNNVDRDLTLEPTVVEPVAVVGDPTSEQATLVVPHPATERKRVRAAIIVPLIISGLGYGGLHYADRMVNGDPARDFTGVPDQSPQFVLSAPAPNASSSNPGPGQPGSTPAPQDVIDALAWLGHQSLEEFRLTAPPKDNAHYYFTKLMQLAPDNPQGPSGYAQIAERFAMLAERELAESNEQKALDYISIGLQIDPENPTLRSLHALAGPKKGMLGSLFK